MMEKIENSFIEKWGTEKFVKIIMVSIFSACISALVAESIIPDDPKTNKINFEKESY